MASAADTGSALPHPENDAGRDGLDDVFSAAYEELRRLAATLRHGAGPLSVTPTMLVHEAWLKLARSPSVAASSPLHFRRIAARAMRQVLVEAARRRATAKRGGGAVRLTLDESLIDAGDAIADDVLALDDALRRLAALSPRQAAIVEHRFFAGLGIPETASVLDVSEATVQRDWRAARAWLARELGNEP